MAETLFELIQEERERRRWTQPELAERMTELSRRQGEVAYEFSFQQVARLEDRRRSFRPKTDPSEPLWWALRALGIDEDRARRLIGL